MSAVIRLIETVHGRAPSVSWDLEAGRYPDGTPYFKADDDGWVGADTMLAQVTSPAELQAALHLADAVQARGGYVQRLVLPYIPGGRQDRVNPEGDVLFTLASVAKEINLRKFERVVTVDPHSFVSGRLIRSLEPLPFEEQFRHAWAGYTAVIAPDKGAMARAQAMADRIGRPAIFATKHRDTATGRLSDFEVDVQPGGHYLVADDICDGGGTFIGLGERILEQGAHADLYVTHGLFTKGVDHLLDIYKRVTTTDSVPFTDNPEDDIPAGLSFSPIVERLVQWTR